MSREIPQAQAEEAPALPVEREVRQASLIGSFLKEKDFVYTLKRPAF
ncbi:hypothetical protein [Domibacillus robiginosus]|nr:hypothetical protein [Domibacillus robiginosus]